MKLYMVQLLVLDKANHRLVTALSDVLLAPSDDAAVTDLVARVMVNMGKRYDGKYPFILLPSLVREVHYGLVVSAYASQMHMLMEQLAAQAKVVEARPEYGVCPTCGGAHSYRDCPVMYEYLKGMNEHVQGAEMPPPDLGGPKTPPDAFRDFFDGLENDSDGDE